MKVFITLFFQFNIKNFLLVYVVQNDDIYYRELGHLHVYHLLADGVGSFALELLEFTPQF